MVQQTTTQRINIFTALGLFLGLCYIVLTPPFQVPDEINHFYRAWQVSQGDFRAERTINRIGGELPASLRTFTATWEPLIGNPEVRVSKSEFRASAKLMVNENKAWFDFPNTAIYSAVNYLPQTLGIVVFRWFTDSVLAIFYGARVFALCFWLAIMRLMLRLLPGKGLLAAAVLLLPMSLYINSSLSADIMINAVSAVWLAWIIRIRRRKKRLCMADLVSILLLSFLIPMLKLVYLPLLLLLLLVPKEALSSRQRQGVFLMLALTLVGLSGFISLVEVDRLYIPYADYAQEAGWVHLAEGADKSMQTENILHHPAESILVVLRSLIAGFSMYSAGLIGNFGWLEIQLTPVVVVLSYLALLLISLTDRPIALTAKARLVLILSVVLTAGLLVLSQYIMWTPVGSDLVLNLQGRYFIPLLLPFLIIIPGKSRRNLAMWTSISFVLLINTYSLWLIAERFYGS